MRKRWGCCQTKNALQDTKPKENFFIGNRFEMPQFAIKGVLGQQRTTMSMDFGRPMLTTDAPLRYTPINAGMLPTEPEAC
jgi:hypothetical protein